jgi:hypothetical protein
MVWTMVVDLRPATLTHVGARRELVVGAYGASEEGA